jgi:drug/metabolite transporter (DMT)-like permease
MTKLTSVLLVVIGCVTSGYAGILLKKGADKLKFSPKALIRNKPLIFGLSIYAIGTCVYIYALRGAELSLIYPLVSTTYIWVAIFSQKILGEKMNKYKWAGIGLILAGVSLIGFGSR